ncbi:unnamed protein product [Aphanomyces euteiches]|nr:hypothetical protein AeRB84_009841 [Aphanomyces euteiches]
MDGSAASAGLSLQEVPLVYAQKDDDSMIRVRSKFHQTPPYTPPLRVESMAGGRLIGNANFVSYRAIGKQIFLWENTVYDGRPANSQPKSESGSAIAIQLPECAARNGVSIFESADKQVLSVCVVTCAKTVHRFCYKLEPQLSFADAAREEVAYAMTSIPLQTSITSVCWLDECNTVVGADNGSVVALNVGLSIFGHSASSFHEVPLTDHSVLQWVWNGLGLNNNKPQPILAIAPVPDTPNDPDSGATSDTLIVTLSADLVLRVWSYEQQSCLCNQNLRALLESDTVIAQASIRFVGASQRLLIHITSHQPVKTKEIVLFRGELNSRSLDLEVIRRFVVNVEPSVRLVDFTVDATKLYSVWRSASDDFVFVHPLALTGPKIVPGQVVGGMQTFSRRQLDEDNQCDATDLSLIDAYFLQRLFAADRFNEECIRTALGSGGVGPLRRQVADAIHREWLSQDKRHLKESHLVRIDVWKQFVQQCAKHWATENIPLGIAVSIAGSPVLLRRNHMSIFFPSTRSIVSTSPQVHELQTLVVPFFEGYPHSELEQSFHREWNIDIHVDLTAPSLLDTVRKSLHHGLLHTTEPGRALPHLLVRVAALLTGDAAAQIAGLDALVQQLTLFDPAASPNSEAPRDPTLDPVDMSMALHRMSAVVIHDMFTAACSVLYFLALLDDTQPTILAPSTLQHVASALVPRAVSILRTWTYYKWLFAQSSISNGRMVMQDFAQEEDFSRSRLGDAVLALLHSAYENPSLLSHLKETQRHDVLRVVVRFYLQRLGNEEGPEKINCTRLLGDALVADAANEQNNDEAYVAHCLERAVRCYVAVLSMEAAMPTSSSTILYDVTAHLKENIPRSQGRFLVSFLQASLAYARNDAMSEFVWYNLLKASLAEKLYHDALLALHRVVTVATDSEECIRHFVLHLCDAGRLDVITGFSWGAIEDRVEALLIWQAANTHANLTIKRPSQNSVVLHRLLYSFYVKRARYAHAARAMHTLFQRLQVDAFSLEVLRAQRDALLAASNVLKFLEPDHRWFVAHQHEEMQADDPLDVVTAADVDRDLVVVRGKLLLVPVSSMVLSQTSAPEVVSLLLKHLNPECMSAHIELAVAISRAHDLDVKVVVRAVSRDFAFSSGTERHLKQLLMHLHDKNLYLAAIDSLLDHHAAIPEWLRIDAVASGSLAGQAILSLYLKHGVLEESVELATRLIPSTNVSEAAFRDAVANGSQTWIPYTLLDDLLNACTHAIREEESRGNSSYVSTLKATTATLTQSLEGYFKYLKVLDTATAATRRHIQ